MDDLKRQAEKRVKEGWIHSVMLIEVLAVTEEAARSALEKHVEKMAKEKKSLVFRQDFKPSRRMENPLPTVPVGYSIIVEVELVAESLESLVYLVMNYAPTSVEILHPPKLTIKMNEAQGLLVSVADLVHKFARAGLGGVMINS
ncbi:MAG: hypothetical protein HY369_04945 [Candidatus Aenigmarchaeota archaeon]|nr:hypothetical protein [Candidatus Aenigmarchaeota archaeon]